MGLRLMPTSILLLAAGVHALAQVEVRPRELMQLAANWHGESLEDDWEQVIVLRAGVPLGHVQALNAAGTEIDYAEFVALSGWGFSFAYKYGDVSPGFIAVRGNPDGEEPISAFGWLTTRLGYTFDSAPTKQPENLWPFVKRHIDAGTPILTEHHDGGLITGYRERDGKREVWFAGSAFQDWVAIEKLDPFEVCVLVDDRDPMPREELVHEALERAVRFAGPSRANDVAMGLAAVEAFVEDMADPELRRLPGLVRLGLARAPDGQEGLRHLADEPGRRAAACGATPQSSGFTLPARCLSVPQLALRGARPARC